MANPYVKQTWTDGSGGGTPLSAARMGVIEQGVFDSHFQPMARVFHNASQSIANNTVTTLAFNSESYDTDTMHDTVTNNSRLTAKTAGYYLIVSTVEIDGNATGVRYIEHFFNGTTQITRTTDAGYTGVSNVLNCSSIWSFTVNQYVETRVYQNSGGALNVTVGGAYSPSFMMVRVA